MSPPSLLEYLGQQVEPVTALTVSRVTRQPLKLVTTALDEMANAGQVFAFAQGVNTAYCVRPPLDLCAESLVKVVRRLTSPTGAGVLELRMKSSLRPWFDEALARLVVQGGAYWWPRGRTKLVFHRAMRPSDTVDATKQRALRVLFAEGNRYRRTPRTMEQFLAWLDATDDTPAARASEKAKPTAQLLAEWYQADRAKTSSSMVPIPQTFKHYERWASANHMKADIVDFRQTLESLYTSGAAILEPCERPQDLPHHERELQVPLTLGPPGYYWCPVA
jgi:hypothetical protein